MLDIVNVESALPISFLLFALSRATIAYYLSA